jgi:hypothetical protein
MSTITRLFQTDSKNIRSWNNLPSDAISSGKQLIIGFLKVDKTLSPLANAGMNVRQEPVLVKQEPVKKEEPKQQPVVVTKEEPKKEEPKKEEPKMQVTPASYSGTGFFRDEYNNQTNNGKRAKSSSAAGASFKSTSGWSDGKYYILLDDVQKGTIVMVRNPANGKAVYAKVLAGVQETKPGTSVQFIISNAAAAQLGISAESFSAELMWGD